MCVYIYILNNIYNAWYKIYFYPQTLFIKKSKKKKGKNDFKYKNITKSVIVIDDVLNKIKKKRQIDKSLLNNNVMTFYSV